MIHLMGHQVGQYIQRTHASAVSLYNVCGGKIVGNHNGNIHIRLLGSQNALRDICLGYEQVRGVYYSIVACLSRMTFDHASLAGNTENHEETLPCQLGRAILIWAIMIGGNMSSNRDLGHLDWRKFVRSSWFGVWCRGQHILVCVWFRNESRTSARRSEKCETNQEFLFTPGLFVWAYYINGRSISHQPQHIQSILLCAFVPSFLTGQQNQQVLVFPLIQDQLVTTDRCNSSCSGGQRQTPLKIDQQVARVLRTGNRESQHTSHLRHSLAHEQSNLSQYQWLERNRLIPLYVANSNSPVVSQTGTTPNLQQELKRSASGRALEALFALKTTGTEYTRGDIPSTFSVGFRQHQYNVTVSKISI